MAVENGKKRGMGIPPVNLPPQGGDVPADLPLDLELDLLVDEELPEGRRRELLCSLDKAPEHWRDLSIRFLERQVEKKSVRQLICEAVLVPPRREVDDATASANHRFPGVSWLTPARFAAIAAGLLIAVASALVTTYTIRKAQSVGTPRVASGPHADVITTDLPASMVGMHEGQFPVQLSVSDVSEKTASMNFFPPTSGDEAGTRRSVVIKPDGLDNALVIPVKNLQFQ